MIYSKDVLHDVIRILILMKYIVFKAICILVSLRSGHYQSTAEKTVTQKIDDAITT